MNLLTATESPPGFRYPDAFLRIVGLRLIELEPWYILEGDRLRAATAGLRSRYPSHVVVPFARRQDNDDIACFLVEPLGAVQIIHDFASPGWETRDVFPSVYEWLRQAINDLIEFDD